MSDNEALLPLREPAKIGKLKIALKGADRALSAMQARAEKAERQAREAMAQCQRLAKEVQALRAQLASLGRAQ